MLPWVPSMGLGALVTTRSPLASAQQHFGEASGGGADVQAVHALRRGQSVRGEGLVGADEFERAARDVVVAQVRGEPRLGADGGRGSGHGPAVDADPARLDQAGGLGAGGDEPAGDERRVEPHRPGLPIQATVGGGIGAHACSSSSSRRRPSSTSRRTLALPSSSHADSVASPGYRFSSGGRAPAGRAGRGPRRWGAGGRGRA